MLSTPFSPNGRGLERIYDSTGEAGSRGVRMVSHTPASATTRATMASPLSRSENRIAASIALNAGVKKNKLLTRAAE